jgi:hypothetical protein
LDPDPELDPDSLVKGTDPGIRIRTKMSRIPNTAGFPAVAVVLMYLKTKHSRALGHQNTTFNLIYFCYKTVGILNVDRQNKRNQLTI